MLKPRGEANLYPRNPDVLKNMVRESYRKLQGNEDYRIQEFNRDTWESNIAATSPVNLSSTSPVNLSGPPPVRIAEVKAAQWAQNQDDSFEHIQVSTIRATPGMSAWSDRVRLGEPLNKMNYFDSTDTNLLGLDNDDECKTGLCDALSDSYQEFKKPPNMSQMSNQIELIDNDLNHLEANGSEKSKSQRISVIQEGPRSVSEEDKRKPLKKRCRQFCKAFSSQMLKTELTMVLTLQEERFIQKRVIETRELVKMVQPKMQPQMDDPSNGLYEGRKESLQNFRGLFQRIFGKKRATNMQEIDQLGLLDARFLACAMTSIAVKLFGAAGTSSGMLDSQHTNTYGNLLKSPWYCQSEVEGDVMRSLKCVGECIGQDENLEVLFTTCIMRGYMDPRADFMQMERGNRHVDAKEEGEAGPQVDFYEEPGHPARREQHQPPNSKMCGYEDPDMLTGFKFSLLMYRYLKHYQSATAHEKFKKLEHMIKKLYEAQQIFYYNRLPC